MKTQDLAWQLAREGVFHKLLVRDEERDWQFDLMKIEPNRQFPSHRHPEAEWAYVLRGQISDHRGTFMAGDFFINEKGSEHTASTGPEGVELLILWCGRVEKI